MADNRPGLEDRLAAGRVAGANELVRPENKDRIAPTPLNLPSVEGLEDRAGRKLVLFVEIDDRGTEGVVVITRCRRGRRAGLGPGRGEMAGVFLDPHAGKAGLLVVKEKREGKLTRTQSQQGRKNSPLSLILTFPDELQSPPAEMVLALPSARGSAFRCTNCHGEPLPAEDRDSRGGMESTPSETFSCGDLLIHFDAYEVMVKGKKVDFPRITMKLLFFFVRHPRRVYTREQLLDYVWGSDVYISPRNVDLHVSRIRRAIEKDPATPAYIISVSGVGYKFDDTGA